MLLSALATGFSAPRTSSVTVGDVRVTAISPEVVRVEPKGPQGFEDRTTFMVVDRDMSKGLDITQKSTSDGTLLTTSHYSVLLKPKSPAPTCAAPSESKDVTDLGNGIRSDKYPDGLAAADRDACCAACEGDDSCIAWIHEEATALDSANCWPLKTFSGLKESSNRAFGCSAKRAARCASIASPLNFTVSDAAGALLYDSAAAAPAGTPPLNLLYWPSPMSAKAYALADFPRFFAPPWGAAPAPAGSAYAETNGYDFSNNVAGDTYVFALGSTLDDYATARKAFVDLVGGTPLLPDFAYGTWFTWWHSYTEAEARGDIARWANGSLPIDVWALDMNWRNTAYHQDWYYNHPNTNLFEDFTEWFAFLKEQRLRTYFNDHPYPVASRDAGGLQTSKEEVAFRSAGLSKWMDAGLTYWWFDHNWAFSIPPPFVNTSHTSGVWDGLDNAAWGSHLYYTNVAAVDKQRDAKGDDWYGGRPMTLTKFGLPDWRPGMAYDGAAESPAQHRYPVWWTGDGVNLQASIESMVDGGVHGFKPFVHSDCGGDYRGSAGDLLRWTAHCTFGSILRFHGNDHRPWTYGDAVQGTIKAYLDMRYKLVPSLVAAGAHATQSGFPLVARCDLYWPEAKPASASNLQYIFLNDTLVAPIYDSTDNVTTRDVWVPPGKWMDVWNGSVVEGPATLSVSLPYERQPMWHRADGGLVLGLEQPATRVDEQDWSTIVLHAFPAISGGDVVERSLHDKKSGARTGVAMVTDASGKRVRFEIGAAADGATRGWHVRMQLPRAADANDALPELSATIDGATSVAPPKLLRATAAVATPFSVGSSPAALGGHVVELVVPTAAHARVIELSIA